MCHIFTCHKSTSVSAGSVERVQSKRSDRFVHLEVVVVLLVEEASDDDATVRGAAAHELAQVVGADLLHADGVVFGHVPEA